MAWRALRQLCPEYVPKGGQRGVTHLALENPTLEAGRRAFDLGPFACHRVPEGAEPMRLDRWLLKNVCSNWDARQKLIASKQVWVMSSNATAEQHRSSVQIPRFRPECQGKTQVKSQDFIYFPKTMSPVPKRRLPSLKSSSSATAPDWLLRRVVYKDTDFLAIDKPMGWTVNPGKHVGDQHLQRLLPSLQFGMEEPPKFVHRLSTEITGVLLLARHKAAAAYAKDMITQRAFWQRDFWALVCGRTPKSGSVSMPLSQERHGTRNVAKPLREDDGGLPAFTEYSSVRFSALCGGLTLLSMNPYSGRHDQTRAHCAFGLRAPIVGDPVYYELSNRLSEETDFKVRYHSADARQERKELLGPMPRLHLHSRQLMIKTFAGKEVIITAPVPDHFAKSFHALGWDDWLRRAERRAAFQAAWRPQEDAHLIEALAKSAKSQAAEAPVEAETGTGSEEIEERSFEAEETQEENAEELEVHLESEGPKASSTVRGRRSRRKS